MKKVNAIMLAVLVVITMLPNMANAQSEDTISHTPTQSGWERLTALSEQTAAMWDAYTDFWLLREAEQRLVARAEREAAYYQAYKDFWLHREVRLQLAARAEREAAYYQAYKDFWHFWKLVARV